MKSYNKKGQAITEMALFGGLILTIVASLLSYIQRQNEQQYVQQEAFRRALYTANTYTDPNSIGGSNEGRGSSAQVTVMQHRRLADGYGRKNSAQTFSASSSAYWAVPYSGEDYSAGTAIVYKVNDRTGFIRYRDYVSKDNDDYYEFRVEDMSSNSVNHFEERVVKLEDKKGITNARETTIRESVWTKIPYTVRVKDSDGIDSNDPAITQSVIMEITQNLYKDPATGQLLYSASPPTASGVQSSRVWRTEF